MSTKLRWGILGAAQIARKNWRAIQLTGNAVVTQVACRDSLRGKAFIDECQAQAPMPRKPELVASYEDLVSSDQVDAIYIPLPTGLRKEWILRAVKAGKHVVCEKPCAVSVSDLEEILGACRARGLQFMDGVMFIHAQRLLRMREVLDDGVSVGKLRRISSAFTFNGGEEFLRSNIRSDSALEPHGCLGDLGWYCIKLSLWAAGWKMPLDMAGRILGEHRGRGSSEAVPIDFSGELNFGGGLSAAFHCSFVVHNQQWAILSGEKGSLRIPDFVLPFAGSETFFSANQMEYQANGCEVSMKEAARQVGVSEHSHGHETAQETCEFRNFSDAVLSGRLNLEWPEQALLTQRVMSGCWDAARKASGK